MISLINEIFQTANGMDNGHTVKESLAPTLTVSCDIMLAATTLLCWFQERGVRMKNILVLKNLQERVISESFTKKTQKILDGYFKK